MRRHARWIFLVFLAAALRGAAAARATPTTDDVLRSIHQNVDSTVDMSKVIPWLYAIGGAVILLVIYNYRRQRQTFPKALNNSTRLSREICRTIRLRPVEFKQLKVLAEEQQIEHPLTLLLCPSVLGRAIHTANPKIDRLVLQQVVQRLRQSLSREKSE